MTKKITQQISRRLAEEIISWSIAANLCVALSGDFGSGKTTFVQKIVSSYSSNKNEPEQEILSPSFNLVHCYVIGKLRIYHLDLYRLENNPSYVNELNLSEMLENGFTIIEWPQAAMHYIANALFLNLPPIENPNDASKQSVVIQYDISSPWATILEHHLDLQNAKSPIRFNVLLDNSQSSKKSNIGAFAKKILKNIIDNRSESKKIIEEEHLIRAHWQQIISKEFNDIKIELASISKSGSDIILYLWVPTNADLFAAHQRLLDIERQFNSSLADVLNTKLKLKIYRS